MFDEFFKELVSLIFVKSKEGYFEFFEVPPAFNVFVVEIVVYPIVSSQRSGFDCCHNCYYLNVKNEIRQKYVNVAQKN